MRPQDKPVFSQAARQFRAWILVRRTNTHSLQYIGKQGYLPKPFECKAKTADQNSGAYRCAGLVDDPGRLPKAFSPAKQPEALDEWPGFCKLHGVQPNGAGAKYAVDVDPASPHFGCVTLGGKYLHGDYDLKDIVLVDHPRGNLWAVEELDGLPHMRGARVIPIQKYINGLIGAAMIQHGGDAQYKGHTDESIDAFGPQGEQVTLLNGFAVRAWYEKWQRPTLTKRR